jgi:predicted aldo/keto reductase-like oxidoreductase
VESPQVQTENLVEHVDVHYVPNQSPMDARSIDNNVVSHEAVLISLEGTEEAVQVDVNINVSHNQEDEHVTAEIQQQEVHPSKNIQHGLDLWERVRQYDERSAVEVTPVLTRKQKQKLKLQQVLQKQPTKTRARGDPSTTAQ